MKLYVHTMLLRSHISLYSLIIKTSIFCDNKTFPTASSGSFLTAVDLPSRISLTDDDDDEENSLGIVLDAQVVRLAGVGLGVELDGRVAHLVAHIVVH